MITSIWFHVEDKCPKHSGYYLAYKLPSLASDEEGYGMYYWDNQYYDWRDSAAPHGHGVEVSIWTSCPEHDPDDHLPLIPTPAEIDAWKKVHEAIDQFNMIRTLVK